MAAEDLRSDETKAIDAAIAGAVSRERERCAKIAEGENQERLARLIRRGHQ